MKNSSRGANNLIDGPVQAPGVTPEQAPHRVRSGRLRIVWSMVGFVAVALAISIAASHFLALQRLDERIDDRLIEEVREVEALVKTGVDPFTDERFPSVRAMLWASVNLNQIGRNETMFALLNGQPIVPDTHDAPLRLDEEPQVMAQLADSNHSELLTLQTAQGLVRFGTVPMQLPGSTDKGVFVVAVFRDLERAEIDSATRTFAAVAFGTLALAALVAFLIAGRVMRPIRLVRQTAQQISATDLSRRIPVQGDDDVAELARTFNSMLDRLQTTFEAQRHFLHDASHELRTPITIMQGHLELAAADPSARAESYAIVMDELERMRRMVEDLLLLAKSDNPNFLRLTEVDLEPFVDEILDKARALAPRWWYVDHRAEGVAVLDRQRITQAMLQLALNATQHTTPEQEIHLGTQTIDGQLHLWVADAGSGVSPTDRERLFDRFTRGADTDGDGSGTGLGLAIVRAIAQAHGGRVVLAETTLGGAEFRLELPLRTPEASGPPVGPSRPEELSAAFPHTARG